MTIFLISPVMTEPFCCIELYSETMEEWGWAERATPAYARSHVHHSLIDHDRGEYVLLPTYRLPTMIHSRSGNAKYLTELSHTHPLLVALQDAERIGVQTGELARVETEIGWFVIKAFVTEGIRPGVVAASHHMGRWRLKESEGTQRWSSALVSMEEDGDVVTFRQIHGVQPFVSDDPSSSRIWWSDAGVHQNITFPVHPDPVSGMHCWHQKVRVRPALPGDRYADISVDFGRARDVYRKWLSLSVPPAATCGGRSGSSVRSSRRSTPMRSPRTSARSPRAPQRRVGAVAPSISTERSTGSPRRSGAGSQAERSAVPR